MRLVRAAARRLGGERGFTMIEMLVSMSILATIMSGLGAVFVSGIRSEADSQQRFKSQTTLAIAIDKLRRELHGACYASTSSVTSVSLKLPGPYCTGTMTDVTWCTRGSGSRYGLYRVVGTTCTGGIQWADYLVSGSIFSYTPQNGNSGSYTLPRLRIDATVDPVATDVNGRYHFQDDIVFRNGQRT